MAFSDRAIDYLRTASGMEAGGYYGVGKLLRALAYAEEVQAVKAAGIPRGDALLDALQQIIDTLQADGTNPAIIEALEQALLVVKSDRTVPYELIPAVQVSRTSGEIFLGDPPTYSANHDYYLGLRTFLPVWYFEAMSPSACMQALQNNIAAIEAQFSDLSAEQCLLAPAPGEWNMHQLLWHLVQAQELLAGRVQKILTETDASLDAAAVWTNQDAGALSMPEMWERYRASREELIQQLSTISADDWWRTAWHSEFGAQTLLSQCVYFARHEISHMPQFGEIRRGLGK